MANSAEPRKDCYNKGNIFVDNFTIGGPNNTGSDLFIGGICYSGGSNTAYTNVHNEGDIEIGANVAVANCLRIGGFICNAETASKTNTLTDCSNSGDITVRATNSINSNGVVRIGGFIAQHQKGTLKLLGTIKNSGNINYAGLQKGAIGTSIGGIFGGNDDAGDMNGSCALIINEGTVEFTGETVQKFYMGGIAPYCTKYAIPATVKLINTGDVKATGKCGAGMEADCAVVGMIRTIKSPIDGVQCFCNVYAPKYPAKTGILSGNARDAAATMYSNAKVGGTICKSQTTSEYEEADGTITTTVTDNIVTLDATNFFSYIYGTDNWAGVENYDGCTVISSKEEIDYTVPVAPEA
jgi:hypothetical protein